MIHRRLNSINCHTHLRENRRSWTSPSKRFECFYIPNNSSNCKIWKKTEKASCFLIIQSTLSQKKPLNTSYIILSSFYIKSLVHVPPELSGKFPYDLYTDKTARHPCCFLSRPNQNGPVYLAEIIHTLPRQKRRAF